MRGEPVEPDAGVARLELPVALGVMIVAMVPPGSNLSFEYLLVGNAAAQALARQNAEFGFGHVEPTSMFGRVVPFESFHEAASCLGRSFDRLLKEPERVGVLDQRSHLGALKAARHFGFDLKPELDLATRQCRELFDDCFDDLMDVARRSLR
jgi:hypothetical protein